MFLLIGNYKMFAEKKSLIINIIIKLSTGQIQSSFNKL